MVDRLAAKAAARNLVRSGKVNPLLLSLLYLIIIYVLNTIDAFMQGDPSSLLGIYSMLNQSVEATVQTVTSPSGIFANILILLITVVLQVGFMIYCLGIAYGREMPYTSLFDGFSLVGRIIALAVIQYVFIFLWSCLFVIPGVIASYRYRFAYYNLIEYGVGPMEAIRMSKQQTYGFKGALFTLDITFLGWTILTLLTLNIASIWVMPYYRITDINYYFTIRNINPVTPNNYGPSGGDDSQNE